jgi:hypothetical protein
MQCACAVLSSVVCPSQYYFSTLSPKRQDFRKKFIEHKMLVLIFSTNVTKKIPFSGELSEMILKAYIVLLAKRILYCLQNVYCTACKAYIVLLEKYPFFWSDFSEP